MPTYEYLCQACGHQFEFFQQMSDGIRRKCPECGRLKLQRLIGTGAGVIFKGGGFYETDYRSESYRKAAEADKKAADGSKDGAKDGGGKAAGAGEKPPSNPNGSKKPAATSSPADGGTGRKSSAAAE